MIVVEKQGHLDTGLLGTFILLDLLIQENRNDLVDLIVGQTTYPGWGYLVKELDLKTWPETWSGWGSHVILVTATPGSWFFEGLAGIRPDAAARAYVRGNRDIWTDLKFVGIEPYVVPKRSLTGDSTERVDTRVLQVLYAFEGGRLPIYVGQQMDVFIDAPPAGGKWNSLWNRLTLAAFIWPANSPNGRSTACLCRTNLPANGEFACRSNPGRINTASL
jgi:hypothetical protein